MDMRNVLPTIGIVFVLGLTLVSGVVQGRMSNRWGHPPDMLAAGKRLEQLPDEFGNWRLLEAGELDPTAQRQLRCAGSVVGTYRNQVTGDTVTMALFLGMPGPISVHTPEVCFPSRDSTLIEKRQRVAIPDSRGFDEEFWALTFRSNDLDGGLIRVYYAWSTGSRWVAAADPRYEYGTRPHLYKIQLSSILPPNSDLAKSDPCREFLRDLVPVARGFMIEPQEE
jgi:hypothetical protein